MQIVVIDGKEHTVPANWSDDKIISHFKKQHAENRKAAKNPGKVAKEQKNTEDLVANQVKNIQSGKTPEGKPAPPKKESLIDKYERLTGDYSNNGAPKVPPSFNRSNLARYGVRDPIAGALTTAETISRNPLINPQGALRAATNNIKPTDYYKKLGVQNPGMADKIAGAVPEYAASLFIPELQAERLLVNAPRVAQAIANSPRALKAAGRVAGDILPQMGYTALTSEHAPGLSAGTTGLMMAPFSIAKLGAKSHNPLVRWGSTVANTGLGGITSHLAANTFSDNKGVDIGATTLGAILGAMTHGRAPAGKLYGDTLSDIQRFEKPGVLGAFERQGQHAYPFEISETPVTAQRFEHAKYTPEDISAIAQTEKGRVGTQAKGIDELAQALYDKATMGKSKERAYAASQKGKIPYEVQKKFKQDEVFKNIINDFEKDPFLKQKVKGMNPDTVEYADTIIRELDKKIANGKVKGSPEYLGKERLSYYTKLRDEADAAIKEANPQWARAKRIARREILADSLMEAFKGKEKSGYTLKEFFAKPDNVKSLREAFANDPRALSKIEDWITISENLSQPKLDAMARRAVTGEHIQDAAQVKSDVTLLKAFTNMFKGRAAGSEALNILTNPKWDKDLPRMVELVKSLSKTESKNLKRAGKVGAHGAGKLMNELNRQEED